MPRGTPVNEVLRLTKQGYRDSDIIRYLEEKGYKPNQINDALNQTKIKLELAETAGVEVEMPEYEYEEREEERGEERGEEMAPSIMSQEAAPEEVYYAPTPTEAEAGEAGEAYPYAYPTYPAEKPSTESMEELAEEIINEKWQEFLEKSGDISEFKTYIESRIKSLGERIMRLEKAFDKLQASVTERMHEHSRDVRSIGGEVQALGGAFGKILEPLTDSVKELRELSEEMKRTKGEKKAERLEKLKEQEQKKRIKKVKKKRK